VAAPDAGSSRAAVRAGTSNPTNNALGSVCIGILDVCRRSPLGAAENQTFQKGCKHRARQKDDIESKR
jgi:hypothetical protein